MFSDEYDHEKSSQGKNRDIDSSYKYDVLYVLQLAACC